MNTKVKQFLPLTKGGKNVIKEKAEAVLAKLEKLLNKMAKAVGRAVRTAFIGLVAYALLYFLYSSSPELQAAVPAIGELLDFTAPAVNSLTDLFIRICEKCVESIAALF